MSELKGGIGMEDLAKDGVRHFETLFVQTTLNQHLVLHLSETCAPNLKPRLEGLLNGQVAPGQ
jgi:hypothetical protein